jgi:hypothetical protein
MRLLIKWVLVIMMTLALLTGCQQEELVITLPPDGTTLTKTDIVANLLVRVAKHDGSVDNILDKASCIELVFPVTIETNGQTITVNSLDDLDDIEDLFDDSGDDDVDFVFPIRVVLANHSVILVQDKDELDDLIDQCDDDDDIECIDFKYPLKFNTYDANNQVAATITILDDKALYNFLNQLEDGEFAGLVFPVTVILSTGVEISVTDFDQLGDIIEQSMDDCDEDDDNDYNDDDLIEDNLRPLLTTGSWTVTLFTDGIDRTDELQGYTFTFQEDEKLLIMKNDINSLGDWKIELDDNELELDISAAGEDVLEAISEDWLVTEITATQIKLSKLHNDESKTLIFRKL